MYYSYDWTIQRFTAIDYNGGAPQMWERCFTLAQPGQTGLKDGKEE